MLRKPAGRVPFTLCVMLARSSGALLPRPPAAGPDGATCTRRDGQQPAPRAPGATPGAQRLLAARGGALGCWQHAQQCLPAHRASCRWCAACAFEHEAARRQARRAVTFAQRTAIAACHAASILIWRCQAVPRVAQQAQRCAVVLGARLDWRPAAQLSTCDRGIDRLHDRSRLDSIACRSRSSTLPAF